MKSRIYPLLLLIVLSCLLPNAVNAQSVQMICVKNGVFKIREKCKKAETELTPGNFSQLISLPEPKCEAGEKGDAGTNGQNGDKGQAGFNGLAPEDVLPSGKTITGGFDKYVKDDCEPSNRIHGIHVTFPIKAPVALENSSVLVSKNGHAQGVCGNNIVTCAPNASTLCTGSFSNPTAPPGKVCIYFTELDSSDIFSMATQGLGQFGFNFNWIYKFQTFNGITMDLEGVWAYTAP